MAKLEDGKHVKWSVLKQSKKSVATSYSNFSDQKGQIPRGVQQSLNNAIVTMYPGSQAAVSTMNLKHKEKFVPIILPDLLIAMKLLPSKTAQGPDRIPSPCVKHLGQVAQEMMLQLVNTSINTGYIPMDWRQAETILFPKITTVNDNPLSYRPIAITSVVARMVERIVLTQLQAALQKHNILNPQQYGFRSKHTTEDCILKLVSAINLSIRHKRQLDVIFVDIKKAYDRVDLGKLSTYLVELGEQGIITTYLTNWIINFIHNREYRLIADGCKSTPRKATEGLPQGSVLSPTLFNVFINTIYTAFPPTTEHILYADDMVFWSNIPDHSRQIESLMEASANLTSWANDHNILFSADKTNIVSFSRLKKNKRAIPQIQLQGFIIKEVPNYKYLGVTLQQDGRWTQHIKNILDKVKKTSTWLASFNNSNRPPSISVLTRVVKAVVVPQLTYAINIWQPGKTQEKKLNGAMTRPLATILHLKYHASFKAIRQELGIPDINMIQQQRRVNFLGRVNKLDNEHPTKQLVKDLMNRDSQVSHFTAAPSYRTLANTALRVFGFTRDTIPDNKEISAKVGQMIGSMKTTVTTLRTLENKDGKQSLYLEHGDKKGVKPLAALRFNIIAGYNKHLHNQDLSPSVTLRNVPRTSICKQQNIS